MDIKKKNPHEKGGTAEEGDAQRGGEISIRGGFQPLLDKAMADMVLCWS